MNTKSQRPLVFSLFLFCSVLLRFANIGKQNLFIDEAWSWATTQLNFTDLLRLSILDPHPPLYYFLLKFSLIFLPDSEFGLRALSAILSVATLAIVMVHLGTRTSKEGLFYAALLITVSPFDIYYSQEARMYTLLGFLTVCSYITLVKNLEGEKKYRFLWPLSAILMAWTHVYGVLFAFTQITFLAGYLLPGIRKRVEDQENVDIRSLLWGAGSIMLGTLPIIILIGIHSSTEAGGAWVPTPRDLSALFLLWTTGLAPVREYFLDSSHLISPSLANLPTVVWISIGMIAYGMPAVWGLYKKWTGQYAGRVEASLAITMIVLPILIVFLGGVITLKNVWALKSFLGCAYLLYIWAGIGIGSMNNSLLRKFLGGSIMIVAIASLIPYYTTWQKNSAANALESLTEFEGLDGIIVEPAYLSPLIFYYLDTQIPAYAIIPDNTGQTSIAEILPSDHEILGNYQKLSCAEFVSSRNLFVYEYNHRARESQKGWPACILSKKLWTFRENQWYLLNP